MLSLSILLLAPAALISGPAAPALRAHTAKSLNTFGVCFTRAQEADSKAWAFVPNGKGGVFTNAGAEGITKPYFLRVIEGKPRSQVQLFADESAAKGSLVAAVQRCG